MSSTLTARCNSHRRVVDLEYVLGIKTAELLSANGKGIDRTVCRELPNMHYHAGARCLGPEQSLPVCDDCPRRLVPFAIKATTVPGVSCEAKCQTAEGSTCRCSCGGRRHGRERE